MFIIINAIFATTITPDVSYNLSYPQPLLCCFGCKRLMIYVDFGNIKGYYHGHIIEFKLFGELIKYACITINRAESKHTLFYRKIEKNNHIL